MVIDWQIATRIESGRCGNDSPEAQSNSLI